VAISVGDALLKIGVDTKEAMSKLEDFGSKIKATGQSISKASTPFLVAGTAIVGALGLCVKAAAESEKSEARLTAALKATGQYSEETKNKMLGLSTQMQKLAGVSDEAVTEAQSFGLQLGLSADQVSQLIPKVMDLSAATGIDMETAMRATAQAVEGNTGMLQRYGVKVLDVKKLIADDNKEIEKMQKEFDKLTIVIAAGGPAAAEAAIRQHNLGLMIAETKEQLVRIADPTFQMNNLLDAFSGYAGSAEAKGKTLSGQLAIIKETFGDLAEKVGNVLIPIIKDFIDKYIKPLIERLQNLSPQIVENGVKFVALAGAILMTIGVVGKIIGLLSGLGSLFTPTGLILAGIGAFIFLIVQIVKHWDDIKAAFTGFYEKYIKSWLDPLVKGLEWVVKLFEKIADWSGNITVTGGEALGGHLQTGGIVTRPTIAMIGEGGPEAVIPLNQMSNDESLRIQKDMLRELRKFNDQTSKRIAKDISLGVSGLGQKA
jgi:hypothetical protein